MFSRSKNLICELEKLENLKPEFKKAINLILETVKNDGVIYTAGNGGSSSCASHLMEELVGRYKQDRKPIKSICLTSSSDLLSCISNDFKYKNVFARQIECFCSDKDVLILFTSSGNSKNLILAIEEALRKNTKIIVFNGKDGGLIHSKYKQNIIEILIKNEDGGICQEIHTHLLHEIVEFIEKNYER